jgi:DNA-binding MarR family transcriptional regulator
MLGRVSARRVSLAFLLAQVGAAAADRFGERAATLSLTRAQAGLLRALSRNEPMTQQALAEHLGLVPSRLVVLLDELSERGIVERRADATDRRAHALHLSASGRELVTRLGQLAREHDRAFCAPLSDEERTELEGILQKLADAHALTPEVHPGYRRLESTRGPRRTREE